MPDPLDQLLILELGEDRWCCGWAHDSGPEQILPAPRAGDDAAFKKQLSVVLEELEATPADCAVLVAEPPGTTTEARDAIADALFAKGIPMLWMVAAPLLALFYAEREIVTLLQVEETRAYILPVYRGHAVLPDGAVPTDPPEGADEIES